MTTFFGCIFKILKIFLSVTIYKNIRDLIYAVWRYKNCYAFGAAYFTTRKQTFLFLIRVYAYQCEIIGRKFWPANIYILFIQNIIYFLYIISIIYNIFGRQIYILFIQNIIYYLYIILLVILSYCLYKIYCISYEYKKNSAQWSKHNLRCMIHHDLCIYFHFWKLMKSYLPFIKDAIFVWFIITI